MCLFPQNSKSRLAQLLAYTQQSMLHWHTVLPTAETELGRSTWRELQKTRILRILCSEKGNSPQSRIGRSWCAGSGGPGPPSWRVEQGA